MNSVVIVDRFLFFFLFCFISSFIDGQSRPLYHHSNADLHTRIIQNALQLVGAKYEAGTLDNNTMEQLVIYTDKFDCVTFVEYVVALSRFQMISSDDQSLESILTNLRYREGRLDGYGSRIHYFSEWIWQNEKNGYFKNITPQLSGIKYKKKVDFITAHAKNYSRITNDNILHSIINAEKIINEKTWFYIPKNKVKNIAGKIKNGDIIAITTKIKGLDISHTGFAVWKNKDLHLLHASQDAGKVVISRKNLSQYLLDNKNQSGIMVLRCQ